MTQQSIRRRDNSSTEACGYVTFLLSNVFFIIYFSWALLPSHVIKHIDEHYTAYYPPRELAVYIPAYLALLLVFVPILYMGLNMLTCPTVDSIDGIWDTRSTNFGTASMRAESSGECTNECDNNNTANQIASLPAICDEDIKLVNLRIRQQLKKLTIDR
mmetsp:Transcript_4012/g.7157  ORF Transcript_4012/g.7157 Transcript_4012/m.7157 type:complete len:159 (-) Transcript_4012:460-936(-)